jgi:hypothetical protein
MLTGGDREADIIDVAQIACNEVLVVRGCRRRCE